MQQTRQRKFAIICILVSLFLLVAVFLVIPKTESAKAETIAPYDILKNGQAQAYP